MEQLRAVLIGREERLDRDFVERHVPWSAEHGEYMV
jgi:hypothetical protein